jgi:hypothetical protein
LKKATKGNDTKFVKKELGNKAQKPCIKIAKLFKLHNCKTPQKKLAILLKRQINKFD